MSVINGATPVVVSQYYWRPQPAAVPLLNPNLCARGMATLPCFAFHVGKADGWWHSRQLARPSTSLLACIAMRTTKAGPALLLVPIPVLVALPRFANFALLNSALTQLGSACMCPAKGCLASLTGRPSGSQVCLLHRKRPAAMERTWTHMALGCSLMKASAMVLKCCLSHTGSDSPTAVFLLSTSRPLDIRAYAM